MSVAASTKTLPRDANNHPIQAGGTFQAYDASGTVIYSPKTVSTSVITLTVPTGALALWLYAGANDLRFGANATLTGVSAATAYEVLPAGNAVTVPCANATAVYVLRDSADVTLSFHFEMMG